MQYLDFGLGMGKRMPLSLVGDIPSHTPNQWLWPLGISKGMNLFLLHKAFSAVLLPLRDPVCLCDCLD